MQFNRQSRAVLQKPDLERLLEDRYLIVPSLSRKKLMPVIFDQYSRLSRNHSDLAKCIMTDERYRGDDGTPDRGLLGRDPSIKDMKRLVHVGDEFFAETAARGVDWDDYPGFAGAVQRVRSEAVMIASDITELISEHVLQGKKYYGMSLRELERMGRHGTVIRLLSYLPGSNLQPKGTAAAHKDRNYITVHGGSTDEGFYIVRDGKMIFLDDRCEDSVIVFLGAKLEWMTGEKCLEGTVHGVLEQDRPDRIDRCRNAAIVFAHSHMPPQERAQMCDWLDWERNLLAAKVDEIRKSSDLLSSLPLGTAA